MFSSTHSRDLRRDSLVALGALTLAGVVLALVRPSDALSPAAWIGRFEVARLGQPATLAFARSFEIPAASDGRATLRLQSDGGYQAFVDGLELGTGVFQRPIDRHDEWKLDGISPGPHVLSVLVTHPEGVASLRAALELPKGIRVVTDASWRVDDDAKRIRERGFSGARYPATFWAKPPVSSWVSSSRSSVRGTVSISRFDVSSRIPSRAATE